VTIVAGVILLVPASIGLIAASPNLLSPLPALTAMPLMFLSSRIVVSLLPSLLFFGWNVGLFRGETKLPKRSYVLLVVAAVLTIVWFVVGWGNGLHYQTARYVHNVFIINMAWIVCLAAGFWYAKGRSSYLLNVVLNWVLFAWIAWYAFPYLGEMP